MKVTLPDQIANKIIDMQHSKENARILTSFGVHLGLIKNVPGTRISAKSFQSMKEKILDKFLKQIVVHRTKKQTIQSEAINKYELSNYLWFFSRKLNLSRLGINELIEEDPYI